MRTKYTVLVIIVSVLVGALAGLTLASRTYGASLSVTATVPPNNYNHLQPEVQPVAKGIYQNTATVEQLQ